MKLKPQEGSIDTLYTRLNQYISQFDVEWRNRIEGVSEQQLKVLIDMIEQHKPKIILPQDYIQYLRIMGNNNGQIFSNSFVHDLNAEYKKVIMMNSDIMDEEWYSEDEQSVAVFYHELTGDYFFLYFDSNSDYVIGDERIYDTKEFELVAESMEKFIFQSACMKYEPLNYEYSLDFAIEDIKYKESETLFNKLKEICAKFGMSPLWISDKVNYFFEGNNGLLYINRYSTTSGMICFNSEKRLMDFRKELQNDNQYTMYW